VIAVRICVGKTLLTRLEPLESGHETEIDMIEREMEGGVVVIQPLEVHQHYSDQRLGGVVAIKEDIEVHELGPRPSVPAKA
jgi:hypothetical protein